MSIFWPALCAFFSLRYGIFGYKQISIQKNKKAFVVKDPFCDYLFLVDEKQYYHWSWRPIKLIKN